MARRSITPTAGLTPNLRPGLGAAFILAVVAAPANGQGPPTAAPPVPVAAAPASQPPQVQLAPLPQSVPDKEPFDIPYGAPITLEHAKRIVAAAEAEAEKRGWPMNIAIADPHGEIVAFEHMDESQLPSIAISQNKARTAARWRRETRVFFKLYDAGKSFYGALDPQLTPSPGGLPIIGDGRVIGAIGCSGGTGDQDEVIAKAALAATQ